jgi:hypothetical protein
MDKNRNEASEELWGDLFDDGPWPESDREAKSVALGEFRRSKQRRSNLRRAVLGMGIISVALAGAAIRLNRVESASLSRTMIVAQEKARLEVAKKTARPASLFINERELLATFPPESCFFAVVDGRKILVFRDEAVRKQYFR